MMNYSEQYEKYLSLVNDTLENLAQKHLPETSQVCQAARYSLFSGGKRIRAILTLAVCDMLNGDLNLAGQAASAVEMLHCYSLIHDDLPCMDNDDFRRGKPSCHKTFGEGTAVLAGDLLLTEAFAVLANMPCAETVCAKAVQALAKGGGSRGMIYGQELDLYFETVKANEIQLQEIHKAKTGALINTAVQLGAICANADEKSKQSLSEFAFTLGLVFQIVDDILDETSTWEELGKPIGSDAQNGKTTFVSLYGIEGARKLALDYNSDLLRNLMENFGDKAQFLSDLSEKLLERRN